MISTTSRTTCAGLLLAGVATVAIWALYEAGWLTTLDGAFYDRILSWNVRHPRQHPKVLVVKVGREDDLSGENAVRLLNVLGRLGAREIVCTFVPRQASSGFFEAAAKRGNIVFGRELTEEPDRAEASRADPLPAGASALSLRWAVVHLASPVRGVYRWQQFYASAGTNMLPTLERQLAVLRHGPAAASMTAPFLVSFVGPPGSIPNIQLARVLEGDLVPEMVNGMAVLVGVDKRVVELTTPLCRRGETMPLLEYQANSLQTVLQAAPLVRPVGRTIFLCGLIIAGFVSSSVYRRLGIGHAAWLAGGIIIALVIASALILKSARLWLPTGTLVVQQAALFALTVALKYRADYAALQGFRLRLLSEVKERACPDSVFSPTFWDNIVSMVLLALPVDRMLFLEFVPRNRLLRKAAVYGRPFEQFEQNCCADDPVFARALEAKQPIALDGEKSTAVSESQYVSLLKMDGEVLGFWVVGTGSVKVQADGKFAETLAHLSAQIASLMREQHRISPRLSGVPRLKTWLSKEGHSERIQEMRNALDLLQQRQDALEALLARLGTAVIAYDRFGRLLYMNEPASALLRAENFTAHSASAFDLIRSLVNDGNGQVHQILRRVIVEGAPVTVPLRFNSQEDRRFLLRLRAVTVPAARSSSMSASSGGLACELIDTTVFSSLARLKGVVAERLGVELRNHLASIEVSANLIESGNLSPEERNSVLEAIHQKTASCIHVISECEKYLGSDVDAHVVECHPVDALELLVQARAEIAEKALTKRVTFKTNQPHLMGQVLASKTKLKQLLVAIYSLLLDDAGENTAIRIEVENASGVSLFRFSNSGFGLPNEKLQQILTGPEAPVSPEFQTLRESLGWTQSWNGSLELSSAVGTGYCVVMRLNQFTLPSPVYLDKP